MKIIRPFTVSDVSLVSSTVPETDYTAFNPATAYVTGNRCIVTELSSAVTITIANPAVISWVAHGFVGGEKIRFTTTGALPTGIVANTLYYVTNVLTDSFEISQTHNGVSIITTGIQSGIHTAFISYHRIYEALRAVTGIYPHKSVADWLEIGATNLWKMFDGSVTSQTTNPNTITLNIQTTGRVDSVAFLNMSAASVTITGTDATLGVVYGPTTYSLATSTAPVGNWWSYYFEPVSRKSDFIDMDFPPYNNLLLTVTLTDVGNMVAVGAVVFGLSKNLGTTQYGAQVGIMDYSSKTRDAFGNFIVMERAYSKTARFNLWLNSADVDGTHATLAAYRATPCVYYGATDYSSTIVYGYYKTFNIDINYPTVAACSIDVEGLT